MQLRADAPLNVLHGVGPVRQRALAEAGIRRIADLLYHLPLRYEGRSAAISVAEARALADAETGANVTVRGRLTGLSRVRSRRRGLALVRGRLEDGGSELPVVWFNRPYLVDQVKAAETYVLHGQLRSDRGGLRLVNPSCEPLNRAAEGPQLVPVYPSLGRLGPAEVRRLIRVLLRHFDPVTELPDPLPDELRERHALPPLGEALKCLHDPASQADAAALNLRTSESHHRLVYGELLALQLELAVVRRRLRHRQKGHRYVVDERTRRRVRDLLPFRLTAAQRRVLGEIVDDLKAPEPMLRLLQGDVGCGKTIVAVVAVVLAMESGLQAAFMAPTELLAEQHFLTLKRILGDRYRIALVTASSRRGEDGQGAGPGWDRVQLAIGTQALIQERIAFERLALVVIDEQHRFGVAQRQRLQQKGERPDVLVMTATPIPRSLALTAYGDLDLSVIDALPPGRQEVRTEVLPERRRDELYRRLAKQLAEGAQAFVVFPLIEESEHLQVSSLERRGDELRRHFNGVPSAVVHGRTPREEREAIMSEFAAGRIRLLLATTVIEVGVDVPNATVMVIESAERFGMAQLHQLRGRVGRGSKASFCVAMHGSLTDEARWRLRAFGATGDGFRIAEADLEQRGPGDLLGTRQAGLPSFRVASLGRHWAWIERARRDARELVERLSPTELEDLRRGTTGPELEPFGGG